MIIPSSPFYIHLLVYFEEEVSHFYRAHTITLIFIELGVILRTKYLPRQ